MIRKIIEATFPSAASITFRINSGVPGVRTFGSARSGLLAHLDDGGFRHSGSSASLIIIRLRQVSQCQFKP
jgi:hypothetical protein